MKEPWEIDQAGSSSAVAEPWDQAGPGPEPWDQAGPGPEPWDPVPAAGPIEGTGRADKQELPEWAAKGVDLREPLKPWAPAVAQHSAFPATSVIVIIVLLNVE